MTRGPALLLLVSLALSAMAQVTAYQTARVNLEAQQVTAQALQALATVIRDRKALDGGPDHPPAP